eukprot:4891469-Prymnesium_polylepis.1
MANLAKSGVVRPTALTRRDTYAHAPQPRSPAPDPPACTQPRSQDLEARISVAAASRLSIMRQSARERETGDTRFTRDTVTRVTIDWDEPQTPVGKRKD